MLSRHRPEEAIGEFRAAAEVCTPRDRHGLSRILYYLGLALERSGYPSLAVKSWVSARKLERGGGVGRAYARWVNDYGMRRMPTPDADDYCAFKAAQIARYLSKRGSGRFGSRAEHDVVVDLIADAWATLRGSGMLIGLTAGRKMNVFRRARVDLPFLYLEDAIDTARSPVVGDFRRKALGAGRVSADGRCPCGSGESFLRCCGVQASCIELEFGSH